MPLARVLIILNNIQRIIAWVNYFMTMKSVKNLETFGVYFMHNKVKSAIEDCHIFESSYDETSNFLIVSSYELLKICQASIVDET